MSFSVKSLPHFRASKHTGNLSLPKCVVLPLRFSVSRTSACLMSTKHSLLSTSISLHHPTYPTQSFSPEEENGRQLFNDDVTEFLVKECGVYNSQLPSIHRRIKKPLSLQKFLPRARRVLQLFRDLGFTPHQVRTVIKKCPRVLKSNVDLVKSKMDILTTVGLTRDELAMVITRNPRFLGLSCEENINPKIRFLANLFGSEAHLSQAIKKAPGILSSSRDVSSNVAKKLKLMKSIGFLEDDIKDMLKKYPRVLCVNIETVDKWLKHAANLGLTDEEIKQVIAKRPLILLLSVDKIQKNMDFLTHTAGFEPNIVCNYPIFLFYSVEKRLKPRFMLYKYLNQSSEPLPLSLASMFTQSDEDILCRFLSDLQTFKLYASYVRESSDIVVAG